jgi:hypothetical protein
VIGPSGELKETFWHSAGDVRPAAVLFFQQNNSTRDDKTLNAEIR